MTVFVDTSALYALLDRDDANHAAAATLWPGVLDQTPTTHDRVVVESVALVQHRLGLRAVRALSDELLAPVSVRWIDEATHDAALRSLLAAGKRSLSLVDWTSFTMMRDEGITEAFAFDPDFRRQGFQLLR